MGVEVDAFGNEVRLNHEEERVVNKMRGLLGNRIDDSEALELYASVMYLMPHRELLQSDIFRIVMIMHEEKPQYSKDQVVNAVREIAAIRDK